MKMFLVILVTLSSTVSFASFKPVSKSQFKEISQGLAKVVCPKIKDQVEEATQYGLVFDEKACLNNSTFRGTLSSADGKSNSMIVMGTVKFIDQNNGNKSYQSSCTILVEDNGTPDGEVTVFCY